VEEYCRRKGREEGRNILLEVRKEYEGRKEGIQKKKG
jgi:hypothetical protein